VKDAMYDLQVAAERKLGMRRIWESRRVVDVKGSEGGGMGGKSTVIGLVFRVSTSLRFFMFDGRLEVIGAPPFPDIY